MVPFLHLSSASTLLEDSMSCCEKALRFRRYPKYGTPLKETLRESILPLVSSDVVSITTVIGNTESG
jgi:hypothetical protein